MTINQADLDPLGEWPVNVPYPKERTMLIQNANDKADAATGWKVHEHLKYLGIETPFDAEAASKNRSESKDSQLAALQGIFYEFMYQMALDMDDDSLTDTPKRMAKMYLNEMFSGLDYNTFPKATVVQNKMRTNEMVLVRNIDLKSMCEHHLLPITGVAHVAYIPDDMVMGLSKLSRIVDFFARRPQIQERLTSQIHATLCFLLGTEDVAVIIEAEHMCMKARGVEDPCADTVTSKLGGKFLDPAMRAEFMSLRHKADK